MTIIDIMASYHTGMDNLDTDIAALRKETTIALVKLVNARRYSYTNQKCYVCGFKSYHYVTVDGYEFPICQNCQAIHGKSVTH